MKVVVLLLLAILAVYCTAKPLKGKDSPADTRDKAFSRMKMPGDTQVKVGFTKPRKEGRKPDFSQIKLNFALEVGEMGKTVQKKVDSMQKMWEQFKKN